MATYTPNLGLHQWTPEDSFLRTDFNTDFLKIDQSVAAGCRILTGYYTGDGETIRVIDLGETPKAVFLCTSLGITYSSNMYYGGLFFAERPLQAEPAMNPVTVAAEIITSGFQVYYYADQIPGGGRVLCNMNGTIYHYMAYL